MLKSNWHALALFAIFTGAASAQIGTIDIFAGNAAGSFPGNGGLATNAVITNPIGLAVDANGNLYIAASGNSLIREVNASTGIITTVAGGGAGGDGGLATAAQLSGPCGVALDSAGNIYLSETCVSSTGGAGGGGSGGGIARIRRVDATTGIITTIAGATTSGFAGDGGPATSALLFLPSGLAFDSSNNIFIADSGNNRIRRIDAVSGIITTVAGNGTAAFAGDGGFATSASLNAPNAIAVDANGNLYIADTSNNRIRRVDAVTGVITTVAGTGLTTFNGDAIAATTANLNAPVSVALNSTGNVVVAELLNKRVRLIDNSGLIWTIAGDGLFGYCGNNCSASLAELNGPAGLAFQPSGSVFISEMLGDIVNQVVLPSTVAATAITVPSTAASVPASLPVTLTATLVATNGTPSNATGYATFFDGTAPLSQQPVSNGAAQFTTSTLAQGNHSISAAYSGDSNFGASSAPVFTLTITAPPPQVYLSVSPNPASANQPVTLTAAVSPTSANNVTFYNGSTLLGSASLNGNYATLTGVTFPAGTYSLTAQFQQGTSQPVTLTVQAAASSLAVTSNLNPSNPSQPVTFTATVTPSAATGTVQFSDGSTVLGAASIASGIAAFSTSALAPGQHSISARYSGDANYLSSTAPTITQTVRGLTSVALASSTNPAYSNTTVAFTAAVTPASATGTVQFLDGVTLLGTASLSGGSAVFSTSALNQGTHSITAAYGGDASDAPSTSAVLTQSMKSSAGMTTGYTGATVVGQTVTFTANVISGATGTVQFTDGSTVLATIPLASGAASYATSSLTAGSHTIGVSYSGDSNYMSQSTSFPLTILATTTTTLTSSLNPSTTGQSVALTATVSPAASTGTVSFYDGSTLLGTVTLNSGTAAYSTSSLTQGTHAIGANYSGDSTHNISYASLSQSVKSPAGLTTGVSPSPAVAGQTVTLTANVNSAATGTVQFIDGSTVLATVAVASGTASYATSTLAAGSHTIGFTYSGDSNYMSQSTAVPLTVLSTTTTTLTSSANPSTTSQSVTLTATVSPSASTGTVSFYDGSTLLGTVTLSSGTAAYSISSLTQGTHAITATYSGDPTHNGSSATYSQSVKSPAGLTTGVSPSPAVAGQTVTLTANVNSAATGTVTFTDGSTTLATVAVSSGHAAFSTASLAAGSHSLGFSYSGDSNYLPATASFTETVLAFSTVAVASNANPSTVGQTVTFTASVTPSTATGTVQFLDSGSVIGTVSLASGAATFSTASLAQGSHSITASYGGDANDAAASSTTLSQVVNAAAPPNPPSNLTATSAGSTQINLAWTASSTSGVAYNVYASTTSGFTPSASNRLASGITATAYSATGLAASTTYYFRVTATKSGLESTASNQASAATSGSASCHVSYSVSSQWGNGFNGAFSIQNTGSTTMTSWTLTWVWAGNQEVTQSWNANYKQTGANVTMTNMSYNNSIAPGATLSGMGFGASYSGTNTSPTAFYVNGTLCH